MSYIALARKYRPKNFFDIIGQKHVSTTLSNALKNNRISHAYLLSGPRGVGKTTVARILAKTVNCLDQNLENRPCMKCEICKEEKAMDIIEIDGASNRGIDEIREIRDNVKFAPLYSKYKIYIIDEVHMLTEQAFNALLKTLEEPPEHIIFIFATTEIHKIPDTILSRCQKFNFRLLSSKDIIDRLKYILDKENIKYEEAALNSIARESLGSMRDSLSILDQIIAYSPEIITKKEADFVFGIINSETIFEIIDDIFDNQSSQILKKIETILKEGYDLNQFIIQLREHYRVLMFFKIDEKLTEILEILPEDFDKYKNQAEKISLSKITRDLRLINQALDEMKRADYPRVVCEIYLTKLSQPYLSAAELLKNLKNLIENDNFKDAQKFLNMKLNLENKESVKKNVIHKETNILQNSDNLELKQKNGNLLSEDKKNAYNVKIDANDLKEETKSVDENFNFDTKEIFDKKWEEFLSKVAKKKMFLKTYLEAKKGFEFYKNKIIFLFENKLFCEGVEKNNKLLEDILEELTNKKIKVGAKIKINDFIEKDTEKISYENLDSENGELEKKSMVNSKFEEDQNTEEPPLPDKNVLDENDFEKVKVSEEDIVNSEPKIKEIIDLFDGKLLL